MPGLSYFIVVGNILLVIVSVTSAMAVVPIVVVPAVPFATVAMFTFAMFTFAVMVSVVVPVVAVANITAFADYRLVPAAPVACIPCAVNIMTQPRVTLIYYNLIAVIAVVIAVPYR